MTLSVGRGREYRLRHRSLKGLLVSIELTVVCLINGAILERWSHWRDERFRAVSHPILALHLDISHGLPRWCNC